MNLYFTTEGNNIELEILIHDLHSVNQIKHVYYTGLLQILSLRALKILAPVLVLIKPTSKTALKGFGCPSSTQYYSLLTFF